jgi:hypothetical protein
MAVEDAIVFKMFEVLNLLNKVQELSDQGKRMS